MRKCQCSISDVQVRRNRHNFFRLQDGFLEWLLHNHSSLHTTKDLDEGTRYIQDGNQSHCLQHHPIVSTSAFPRLAVSTTSPTKYVYCVCHTNRTTPNDYNCSHRRADNQQHCYRSTKHGHNYTDQQPNTTPRYFTNHPTTTKTTTHSNTTTKLLNQDLLTRWTILSDFM